MIKVVRATPGDAELLAKMRLRVWQQTYRGIYPDAMLDQYDLGYYTDRDQRRIAEPGQFYYFFVDDDICVGYFSYGPYHYGSYKDFSLCLNNLYVLNSHKGMGLGRLAFTYLRDYCREQNIDRFFCGCNANNLPAVSFYLHMGGVQGSYTDPMLPKEDQIIHFEFYLGE